MDTKIERGIPEPSYGVWGRRDQLIFATFLQSLCWFLSLAIYSYVAALPALIELGNLAYPIVPEANWMGSIGGHVAHYLVNDVCGINAFLVPFLPFVMSIKLFFPKSSYSLLKTLMMLIFVTGWSTMAMGYWHYANAKNIAMWYLLPGRLSMQIVTSLGDLLGGGVILLLAASLISVVIIIIFDSFPTLKARIKPALSVNTKQSNHMEEEEKEDDKKGHNRLARQAVADDLDPNLKQPTTEALTVEQPANAHIKKTYAPR